METQTQNKLNIGFCIELEKEIKFSWIAGKNQTQYKINNKLKEVKQ